MKVLVLTKYSRNGASSRLRTFQYLDALADSGAKITTSSLYDAEYLQTLYETGSRKRVLYYYLRRLLVLFTARKYDVLWIEKELFPYCPALIERCLRLFKISFIVDYDDAIFYNYQLSSNRLIRRVLNNKISSVMNKAQWVVAGNAFLAAEAKKAGATSVSVIPTVLDIDRYKVTQREQTGPLVIGWIGSPSTAKYVVEIAEQLRVISAEFDIELHLMGASSATKQQLDGLSVKIFDWSEATEVAFIQSIDIGIMPLIDGPWEKGKCGYKLIQYMACGVPVIASAVGANIEIVEDSQSGLLVKPEEPWTEALTQLLSSVDLRKKMGLAGREAAEQRYSLQVQSKKLVTILKNVAAK
ncbi:glycosyltransferase family 4 protein [Agarivorans sp. MS3-6]